MQIFEIIILFFGSGDDYVEICFIYEKSNQNFPIFKTPISVTSMILFPKFTRGWGDDKKFFPNVKNTRQGFLKVCTLFSGLQSLQDN